jgi:hypothetical protein
MGGCDAVRYSFYIELRGDAAIKAPEIGQSHMGCFADMEPRIAPITRMMNSQIARFIREIRVIRG